MYNKDVNSGTLYFSTLLMLGLLFILFHPQKMSIEFRLQTIECSAQAEYCKLLQQANIHFSAMV